MSERRLIAAAQVLGLILVGTLLIVAAGARARSNTLTAFANYRGAWPDAWRAPVEHQAMEVLARLLPAPEADAELARAAMGVMRHSSSWAAMAPGIQTRLRGVLDGRLAEGSAIERMRVVWEMFALSEPGDLEAYRERITALGGDRSAQAETLLQAARHLRGSDPAAASAAVQGLSQAWEALLAPLDGQPLPWLARLAPAIVSAELAAQEALLHHRRRLLEPYGVRPEATYGQLQPDLAMIDWLDHQARSVNAADPSHRARLEQVDTVMRLHDTGTDDEPVVAISTRIALRHQVLPWPALLLGLGILGLLGGGLLHAFLRLRRGPLPIDVNAETMENVEPIDLDTDAETRSRSAAAITDVG